MSEKYTLGLDIGIASVGAALLTKDQIKALHVRTFDKAETAKEGKSLNEIRRESRLARRRLRRRSFRLTRVRRLFKRIGLVNNFSSGSFLVVQSPWELRSEGLDRLLENNEWASVIYHIIKHRGFQSTRKSEASDDKKAGLMLSGMNHNSQLLDSTDYRTIGEMAWKHLDFQQARRNKGGSYTHTYSRHNLEEELQLLFQTQRDLGNKFTSKDFENAIHELLMARRSALAGDALLDMVGKCTFEPEEYRAPKASYSFERFLWLSTINNLRIVGVGRTRRLSQDELQSILSFPFEKTNITYKQARNILGLEEADKFSGLSYRSDNEPEKKVLFEAKGFHKLRKTYEKADLQEQWVQDRVNPEKLDTIAYALSVFKVDDEAKKWLITQKIEDEVIDAVLNISFSTFGRLSIKALRKLISLMESGLRYDEAVKEIPEYRHHSEKESNNSLIYLPRINKEEIINPVVFRSLNQARKLVNAIVREYGSPSAIHIELARDLSKPFDEREAIKKAQGEYQKNKQSDIDAFKEQFGNEPSGQDLIKWRLYREQQAQCAYSLDGFDLNRLFEPGYSEIDHALPRSRSFDNGFNNKVLVFTNVNREKGNQTPFEFLDGVNESDRWRQFLASVMGNPNYRQAKRNRLLKQDFGGERSKEFRERNLTDTRYACKYFKNHVEKHLKLAGENNTNKPVVVSGQLTGFLRARWGLLKIREDGDLHHALDAAVVAACSRSYVKRLADYSRSGELRALRGEYIDPETGEVVDLERLRNIENHFPQPWEGFRNELKARLSSNPQKDHPGLGGVQPVRVSRAPLRRGAGAAHKETIRSLKAIDEKKSSIKTPLEKLTLKKIPNIVGFNDPRNSALIEAIQQRLIQFDDKGKKAFEEPLFKPSKKGKISPIVRSVKLLETQKSGLKVRHGIADNGDMLRTDVFKKNDNYYLIPIYVSDKVKAELPSKLAVGGKSDDEWIELNDSFVFQFSLYPNDWLKVTLRKGVKEGYYSTMDRWTASISIWAHDRNQNIGKSGLMRGIGVKTALSIEKFHVDMLGRLYPVGEEIRQKA